VVVGGVVEVGEGGGAVAAAAEQAVGEQRGDGQRQRATRPARWLMRCQLSPAR
jgi:hypothetical protein